MQIDMIEQGAANLAEAPLNNSTRASAIARRVGRMSAQAPVQFTTGRVRPSWEVPSGAFDSTDFTLRKTFYVTGRFSPGKRASGLERMRAIRYSREESFACGLSGKSRSGRV
jgi:hypothetical protein